MLDVAVIADDLTGAGDTGVQFLRAAAPIFLLHFNDLADPELKTDPGGLSVYTDSRSLSAAEAAARARSAARGLAPFQPRLTYKKVDSCLRGNIGPETDQLLDELGLEAGFFAPAFPGQGRSTVHDVHLVHGVPVAETEMGRDPVTPVAESRLSTLMAAQTDRPVGRIDLDDYSAGFDHITSLAADHIAAGRRYIAFDAQTREHLDLVARLALQHFPNALLIGSAGLAAAAAARLAAGGDRTPDLTRPRGPGVLFVAGSATQVCRDQVQAMVDAFSPVREIIDPEILTEKEPGRRRDLADRSAAALDRGSVVWQLAPVQPGRRRPADVLAGLADLAARLIGRRPPDGLFLTGGDTARAVLRVAGASGLELQREILPGLVWGAAAGGDLDGRTVVTKSGAFGRPDALADLYPIIVNGKEPS